MHAVGLRRFIVFYLPMAFLAVAALVLQKGWHSFVPNPELRVCAWLVGIGIASGAAASLLCRMIGMHFDWAQALVSDMRGRFGELPRGEALLTACLGGIGEETFFRGLLQPAVGVVLAAIIFALLHIGPTTRHFPWTLMALVAGLLFGCLFVWTGSLLVPILAHATVNFLNFRWLLGETRGIYLRPLEETGGRVVS